MEHTKAILSPVYNEIRVTKSSRDKALYSKYAALADGDPIGQFTLVRPTALIVQAGIL